MASSDRSKPLFTADLFASPQPSSEAGSGLSSLGIGDDLFQSPLSLAPAAPAPSKSSGSPLPSRNTPERSVPPIATASLFSQSMNADEKTQGEGEGDGELSTIPLDSPSLTQMGVSSEGPSVQPSTERAFQPSLGGPSGSLKVVSGGWNDPPLLPHFSSPMRSVSHPTSNVTNVYTTSNTSVPAVTSSQPALDSSNGSDLFSVQPLVAQPNRRSESPMAQVSSVSMPGQNPSIPPTGPSSSNPYRMSGGKKPAINTSLAYSVPSSSSPSIPPTQPPPSYPPGSQAPPTSHAHPLPPTHAESVAQPGGGLPGPLMQAHPRQGPIPSVIPVQPHWFYLRAGERYWFPFSIIDSMKLEEEFIRSQADPSRQVTVPTDGGRYDVSLAQRVRTSVYWEEPPCHVRRCSWFFKGEAEKWFMPYDEDTAVKLEEVYSSAVVYGRWNCRVDLSDGEAVIMHSPTALVHYPAQHFQLLNHEVDYSPKSVLRGFLERDKVDQGEDKAVDHLVFVVHGVELGTDLGFKRLVDCVDDFREVSQLMLQTHRFGRSAGRVEFLPIHWHSSLRGEEVGVRQKLQSASLPSISRLREYSNSILTDILFYTSPSHYQAVLDHVGSEMNRMLNLFRQRNPSFSGGVSVMGHAVGSCILFDMLAHQSEAGDMSTRPDSQALHEKTSVTVVEDKCELPNDKEEELLSEATPPTLEEVLGQLALSQFLELFLKEHIDLDSLLMCSSDDLKELSLPLGPRKKLIQFISEYGKKKQLQEEQRARALEARRSREAELQSKKEQAMADEQQGIQSVKIVRGVPGIGQQIVQYPKLNFEPLFLFAVGSPIGLFLSLRGTDNLDSDYQLPTCPQVINLFHPYDPVACRLEPLVCSSPPSKPLLVPHHKGRKRFHLELYENLERVGYSMKHHLVEGVRNMWQQLNELARAHTTTGPIPTTREESTEPGTPMSDTSGQLPYEGEEMLECQLSGGKRLDHVLQEKVIEKLNEYLFALGSHLCYWRSEDTALFLLRRIYGKASDVPSVATSQLVVHPQAP